MQKKLTFLASVLISFVVMIAVQHAQGPIDIRVPTGTIIYFDRTTATGCPGGWSEYTSARGLFFVALTNGGTKATAVGTALTNQEDRTHTHTMSHTHTMAHTHTFSVTSSGPSQTQGLHYDGASFPDFVSGSGHTHTVSGTTSGSSAANTGAESAGTGTQSATITPYMQFLVCSKQ